jgi:hypothetical protein
MNSPCHHAITLAAALGSCAVVRPDFEHGAVFTGVALASTMIPDRAERIGPFRILPHRGPTHRWYAVVLFVALLVAGGALIVDGETGQRPLVPWLPAIGLGGLLGYGGHLLLADGWTKTGLPGRNGKRIRLARRGITTGKFGEKVVMACALVLCFAFTVACLPPSARQAVAGEGEGCERRTVRIYLSQAKYPNVISHIKESWREGYPHVLRINREGTDRRRERLLSRWEREHPQPKGDGLDLDERPAAALRSTVRASVRPIPASENRSEGSRMGQAMSGVCDGQRVMYVFGP